jgi:hypothetical protein
MGGACRAHGEINAYTILIAKPAGERLFGRRRCRWEDNINIDLTEIGLEGVD